MRVEPNMSAALAKYQLTSSSSERWQCVSHIMLLFVTEHHNDIGSELGSGGY